MLRFGRLIARVGLLPFPFILVFFVVLRFAGLNDFPLIDPSEGRYGEIARQMTISGDWIMPRFNQGIPFWGKPPLYFWASALSVGLFGATAFAVRLPSLLFNVATLGCLFVLSKHVFSSHIRILSVFLLFTSGLFYVLSGLTLVDTALSFSITLALGSFFLREQPLRQNNSEQNGGKDQGQRVLATLLLSIGIALSLLAKGLLAFIIIAPPILVWLAWKDPENARWKHLCDCCVAGGIGVALATPWHILAELETPGFLRYYFLGEHFARFTQPGWVSLYGTAHVHPRGTIWGYLLLATLPWSALLPVLLWRPQIPKSIPRISRPLAFLITWALSVPLIFTLSKGIMIAYVLPVLPAWALLGALWVNSCWRSGRFSPQTVPEYHSVIVVGAFFNPVSLWIATTFIMPIVGLGRSEEIIARAVGTLETDHDERITYVQKKPYSADFYLQGKARSVPVLSKRSLTRDKLDAFDDYYILGLDDSRSLRLARKDRGLEEVLRSRKRTLLRERDSQQDDRSIAELRKSLPLWYRLALDFESPQTREAL